ncbi:response regulator [Marinilabiliaceae bacterium JC017]|nr:response regulator [Marinilabiliaceae bacterium JC017]
MGETILVVDDVLAITSLFSELIKRNDPFCRVITAQNGREACKTAATFLPDLIIMDWEMPGMSGIEALIKLKRNTPTKDIPIIITSGASEPTHLKKALDSGAIDYIKKPINELELIARINSALTLSQTIKDLDAQKHKLQNEQSRNEAILSSLLPANILNELKTTGYSLPKRYLNVVVIFVDLVDFSAKTTTLSPHKLIKELNELFSSFDQIMTNNDCTRIKTIGDAYLAVSGLSEQPGNLVLNAAKAAREIQQYLLNPT